MTQSAVSGTIPSLGILEEVDNSLVVKAYIHAESISYSRAVRLSGLRKPHDAHDRFLSASQGIGRRQAQPKADQQQRHAG